eukprot:gene12583-8622_t
MGMDGNSCSLSSPPSPASSSHCTNVCECVCVLASYHKNSRNLRDKREREREREREIEKNDTFFLFFVLYATSQFFFVFFFADTLFPCLHSLLSLSHPMVRIELLEIAIPLLYPFFLFFSFFFSLEMRSLTSTRDPSRRFAFQFTHTNHLIILFHWGFALVFRFPSVKRLWVGCISAFASPSRRLRGKKSSAVLSSLIAFLSFHYLESKRERERGVESICFGFARRRDTRKLKLSAIRVYTDISFFFLVFTPFTQLFPIRYPAAMESSGGASASSFGRSGTSVNRVAKLIDQKWKFVPFLAELEAAPKEYPQTLLWGHMIIDCLQVMSLVLMPEHAWGSAMEQVCSVLNLTHIPLYRLGTSASFVGSMILCIVVTFIYLIFVCYLGARVYFTKRYVAGSSTYNTRLFRAFRHLMYFFSSAMFIPIQQNFISIAYRSVDSDHLVWYDTISKHSWYADASLVICVIGAMLHMAVAVAMWTLFAETNPASQHPMARFNTVPDVLYLVFKFMSSVLYDQFWCIHKMIGYAIWMLVASSLMLLTFMVTLPLYNELTLKIRITMLWLCVVYSILALTSHIQPITDLYTRNSHADLIIFLGSLPILIFVFSRYLSLLRVSSSYKKAFKAMRQGELTNPIVYFPKNLPRYPHLFAHNRAMLEHLEANGMGSHHQHQHTDDLDPEVEKELVARREYEREERHEEGSDPVWQEIKRRRYMLRHFIMPYVDYIMFDSDVELASRFLMHFQEVFPQEMSGYQLRYGAILYIKGLHRFESSGLVHLGYIHFLVEQAMSYSVAVNEMQLLERRELSITVSYRLWKLEVEVTKGLQIGISNRLSALSNAKEMHAASLQRVVELWHELMQDTRHGEGKVEESNRALMRTRSVARQDYENLIYNQPGNLEVLCCYAVFCDHLLDDKDMSNQCAQFVRQFVLNREKNHMQGTRIQASLSAAVTQLKLSLENSKRTYRAVKDRSAIRYVDFFLILMSVILIIILIVVLIMIVLKQKQVNSIQTSIYRLGQIRTLAAQIGLIATEINNKLKQGGVTQTGTLKLLYAYLYDYSTLYNSILFGSDARSTRYIDQFFKDQAAGIYQQKIYNLWTYFGLSLAAMNDVLSHSNTATGAPSAILKADWLANDFPSEMNMAATMAVNTYISQMHNDLDVLIAVGLSCLAVAILVELAMFGFLFFGMFYVEGIRSLVFALVSLVPKNEIRLLYRRKVQRLMAVAGDSNLNSKKSNRTGLLLRSLFAVVPSGRGDGTYISKAEKLKEEEAGIHSEHSESDIELSFAANSAARYSVDDHLRTDIPEGGENPHDGIHAEIDDDERESMKDLFDDDAEARPGTENSARRNTKKRSKNRASIQIATKTEYESVVSEQAYLLSNDKNTTERIFTPVAIVLSVVLFLIIVAVVCVNLIANSKVSNVQDFNRQEINKHQTYAQAIYVITNALLAVGSFAVSQEQRYFKRYIAAQYNPSWQNYRSQISSLQSSASDQYAQESFDLQTMYNGLIQVTDIVMALLCSENAETQCVTNVPFNQIYISELTWGAESTLYMLQVAATMGEYQTFFNVLQGSETDKGLDPATQKKMAVDILASDVFNNYVVSFFEKMTKMDTSGKNTSKNTTKICCITTLTLCGVGLMLVVVEFVYQYRRKRGGRYWSVQIIISVLLAAFMIASLVITAINLRKDRHIDIDGYLKSTRRIFGEWCVPVFHLNWDPIMYINTNGAVLWNYNLQVLLRDYLVARLFAELKEYAHYEVPEAEADSIRTMKRLPLIATVLMYEATKNLPALKQDIDVFDPTLLNEYTWDFEAEPDYMDTYARYHLVIGKFYSTREKDLQLSDAEKIELAKDTLVSYRNDNAMQVLFEALLSSDKYLLERFSDADNEAEKQLGLFLMVAYFAIVQGVIILGSNVELFVRYCRNMVSMKHVSTVTVGQEVDQAASEEATAKASNGTGVLGTPKHGGQKVGSPTSGNPPEMMGSPTGQEPGHLSEENTNNIEIRNANQSVTSNVLADQNRSIMESVESSGEMRKNKLLMISSFIVIFFLLVLTTVCLVLLPIYSKHVLQYEKLIDEASQRRWMVVDTMTSMTRINLDVSSYGVESGKLRQKYDDYIALIYGLYFSRNNKPGQSEYPFVDLERKQDEYLFSRNRFYNNQTFLGTSISSTSLDGIQIVTSEVNGDNDAEYRNNPLFCSYADMVNYMGYYSRGVGLVADAQWTDFVRRCFLYDVAVCSDETFSTASDVFQPLLTGLAQSDIYFIDFVRRSGTMYYTLLLVFIVMIVVVVVIVYFCLFTPFIHALLQDDADSRMLIKILPAEVRSRYPVFEEILDGKKLTKEDNQLQRAMAAMSRMAVFAIEMKNGTVIRFNELAEDMFGYATSDVLGKPVSLFLAEDEHGKPTLQRAYEMIREARTSSQGESKEMLMQRRNGQLFTVSTRFVTVKLSTGNLVVVAYMEEVADRMRLNTLHKINQSVLEMHDDAIIHMDCNGTVLQANPACTRIFGWEEQELVRQNVSILMPKHIARYHNDYIKRYMETGVRKRIDNLTYVEGVHRDGSAIRLGLFIKEISPPYPSELTQFVGYLRDRTTERELESAASVADVISVITPIPLLHVNAKGKIQSASRSACELLNYKDREIINLPIQHIIPETIDDNPQPGFIQRAQLRGPSTALARKGDRSTFPAVLTVRQIEYGSGLAYNIFVGYIADISKTLKMKKHGRMTYAVMQNGIYPVIVADKNGVMNIFNDAAVKCFGYEQQEALGSSYRILCCEDADDDDAGTRDWMKASSGISFENSIYNRRRLVHARKKDGTTFPAELVMTEVPPINDNDAAIVIILRELTDEIKVQRNFHMSELIDVLCPQGILVVDHYGRIERFSPAGEECFGYHAGEVMGAQVQVIIPGLKTADADKEEAERASRSRRSFVEDDRADARKVSLSTTAGNGRSAALPPVKGDVTRIEDMVGHVKTNILGRHFDTRSLNLMIHTAELDPIFQNGDKSYVLYCENISNDGELREASIFYRRIRDVIDSPLLRVDEAGKIVYANHSTASMFGYSSETIMLGKSVGGLFARRVVDSVLSRLKSQVREFQEHRTKSGMAQQQEEGVAQANATSWGAHLPVRVVIQSEMIPAINHDGHEQVVSVSVVQVSSFLNGTISFIFYIRECKENFTEQVAAHTNSLLVTLSTLPLLVLDASGTILHTSQYAVNLLEYDNLEDLLGVNIQNILNTNSVRMLDEFAVHVTSQKATQARRTRQLAKKKSGVEFACEMDLRVVGLESDQPVMLISLKNLQQEGDKDKTASVVNTMLELIRVPAVITNFKGIITNVNEQLLTLFGYGEKDADLLVGKDVGVLMTEADSKFHHRYMANYFQSRIKYSVDSTILRQARHRNGHPFFVNTTIREVTGASKDIKDTMFVGYMTPAPDPKEGEEKLMTGKPIKKGQEVVKRASILPIEHNGRMVRSLEQWMGDEHGISFALLDKLGNVMRLSRAAERLLGFSPGEANGKPLTQVLAVDAYGGSAASEVEHVIEVMATKSNTQYALNVTATSRRGDSLYLNTLWRDLSELRTKILKDWQEMPSSICYFHNTSEQLAATHNKLLCDAAVDACRQPTIFMGEDGIVKLFNPAAERCFGWTSKDVVGHNVRMLMPRKTAEMHDRFLQTYLRTHQAHMVNSMREVTARHADGSRFSAIIRVRDVQQPSTRFFIGQLEDISQRKRDEVFATMSRLLLKQSNAGLLVFDAKNTLVMVSPTMVQMLGYDRESAILSIPNIVDQIFTPSTAKVYREFVQPYQRQAESNTNSETVLLQNFSSALQGLDESPRKRIASAPLRLRSGESRLVDVDVHVAMCGEILIGTVLKVNIPREEDMNLFRADAIADGSARYYPHLMCIVSRSGRVEKCSVALADQLGYKDLSAMETAVRRKPFWHLFPSFPPPQGAPGQEEEARIFTSMMMQIVAAVDASKNNSQESSGSNCPVLRARMQDGGSVVLMVSKVTPVTNAEPPGMTPAGASPEPAVGGGRGRRSQNSTNLFDIAYFVVELQKQSNADDAAAKELERAMVPLLETAPVPMLIADEDGVIMHSNKALQETFDFTAEQLEGRTINILMPRRVADIHNRYLQEYKIARETRPLLETRRVTGETRTGVPVPLQIIIKDVIISGTRCFVASLMPMSNQSFLAQDPKRSMHLQGGLSTSKRWQSLQSSGVQTEPTTTITDKKFINRKKNVVSTVPSKPCKILVVLCFMSGMCVGGGITTC